MIRRPQPAPRRGAIVPIIAFGLIGLLTFVALAIDLGLMMIARTQCQDTADAAAMAGARTLTGDSSTNNNFAKAGPNGTAAALAHTILSQPVSTSQVTVTIGDYYYDASSSTFKINATGKQSGDNWTLAQATVTFKGNYFFGNILGVSPYSVSATATAAHRPRDVVIVMDFSGSMRFDSLLGSLHSGARTQSMNSETAYPQFGHYTGNSTRLTYQGDVQAPSGELQGACNDVTATADGNPVVGGFYGDAAAFGTSTPAFTAAPSSYATTPGGDGYLNTTQNSTTTYAKTVRGITGSSARDANWELDGSAAYPANRLNGKSDYSAVPFYGYTQGPSYWGKTFFIWPPDPRIPVTAAFYSAAQRQSQVKQYLIEFGFNATNVNTTGTFEAGIWQSWPWASTAVLQAYLTKSAASGGLGLTSTDPKVLKVLRLYNRIGAGMPKDGAGKPVPSDWRARFFLLPDGVTPVTSNSPLWSSGTWNAPGSSTYLINYGAILDWIKNTGPNPFPNQLRAGGVVYYTKIPSTIDTSTFPPADPNERFWKEYIDEVLGVQQTGGSGTNPSYAQIVAKTGYGDDFSWGTVQTTGIPGGSAAPYMNYKDNPKRPLVHFWFGPMSLIDFLGNYNLGRFWWPGTVTEAPTYQCKLGVQAALEDIYLNHPNDTVGQVFFSSPKPSANATGYYNYARTPMGRNYLQMINSLWFAPKVISGNAEIPVYDSSGKLTVDITEVPRANGGTCYAIALMLAYNQLSSNPNLVNFTKNAAPGTAGGLGRNGAQKVVIFETDGMVNTGCQANLVSGATGEGYYRVRVADALNFGAGGTEFPTNVGGVSFSTGATQSTTIAQQIVTDFSTANKPVLIHCIAFGSLFNSNNNSSFKTNALQNLANLEVIGNVQTGSPTGLAANKIIVGNFTTRIQNLQAAFQSIMQDGIQVTLISSGPGLP